MSRNKKFNNKTIKVDYKFNSIIITKFINLVMLNGKKNLAEFIVYSSLDLISNKTKKDHLYIFEKIINIVKPSVEIKSRRIGGSTYQIPIEINDIRRNTLAMKWIIESARKKKKICFMQNKLFNEYVDILENKGLSIRKRDEIHKVAESNKAFAYYKF